MSSLALLYADEQFSFNGLCLGEFPHGYAIIYFNAKHTQADCRLLHCTAWWMAAQTLLLDIASLSQCKTSFMCETGLGVFLEDPVVMRGCNTVSFLHMQ